MNPAVKSMEFCGKRPYRTPNLSVEVHFLQHVPVFVIKRRCVPFIYTAEIPCK